jgi:hypothetical protein
MRDALIFAVKLWIDGFKDLVLGVLAIGAAAIDVIRGRGQEGYLFYRVMRLGHKVDAVIDVYGGNTTPDSTIAYKEPGEWKRD